MRGVNAPTVIHARQTAAVSFVQHTELRHVAGAHVVSPPLEQGAGSSVHSAGFHAVAPASPQFSMPTAFPYAGNDATIARVPGFIAPVAPEISGASISQ